VADEADIRAEAEVRLWGDTVGALVELQSGRIIFEYADAFRRRGLEISPIHLPTDLSGPRSFEELRRSDAFRGLPGVFADALPDAFGRRVIRAYYAARGEVEHAMSPVQQLLYVGRRALGALSFHPAEDPRPAEEEALEVQALAHDAKRIVEGRTEVAVPEIYRIGSSAGGKRPKAIVHYDPDANTIRSGGTALREGEVPCILKFDGIGDDHTRDELGAPRHYNRVEAAYGDMARAAGVEMPAIELLEADGYAHLLVRRFDVRDGDRLHQHTFGGMVHVDYNEPGASSYEEYFRSVQTLGMAYDALTQAYRRMAFNVMAVNQDDHVKNLSFHMDRSGSWSLTPAYDVTFARGEGWTRHHQMRVRDRTSDIREDDLLAVADEFGVKRASRILEQARESLDRWEEFAASYEVPESVVVGIREELDERASTLKGPASANS
jgi:serine/threonine-protein kinase HipA